MHWDRGGVPGRAFPPLHHLLPPGSLHPNLGASWLGSREAQGATWCQGGARATTGPARITALRARSPPPGWLRVPRSRHTSDVQDTEVAFRPGPPPPGMGNEPQPLCCGSWAAGVLGQVWRQQAHFAGSICVLPDFFLKSCTPRGGSFRSRFPSLAWCWAAQPSSHLLPSPSSRRPPSGPRGATPPSRPSPKLPSTPCSSPAPGHLGIWQSLATASAPNVNVSPSQPAFSHTSCFSESCPSCCQWPKPKPHLTVHFSLFGHHRQVSQASLSA